MGISKIYEGIITKKISGKAEELGIEFKVKHSIKEGVEDVLLRIKRNTPLSTEHVSEEEMKNYRDEMAKHNEFAEFAADIVVGNYANHIRYSYPTKL